MKYCKKCGARVEDADACFCGKCGGSLTEAPVCPSCGHELAEETAYCVYCGASLPYGETAAAASADGSQTANRSNSGESLDKIVKVLSVGFAAVLALASLVFSFCIGVSASTALGGANGNAQSFLYDYFGKVYTDLGNNSSLAEAEFSVRFGAYFPLAVGTALTCFTLIAAVVWAALSGRAFYKKFAKKENVDVWKAPVKGFLCYVCCSLMFLSLSATDMNYAGIAVSTGLNGATVAGFVIGFILLAALLACGVLSHRENLPKGREWIPVGVTAGILVLSLVMCFLSAGCVCTVKDGNDSVSVTMGMSFSALIQSSYIFVPSADASAAGIVGNGTVGLAVQFAAIALWLKLFSRCYASLSDAEAYRGMFSFWTMLISVLCLVFAVLAGNAVAAALGDNLGGSITYVLPIVVLVFSVLAIGGTIFSDIYVNRLRKQLTDGQMRAEGAETVSEASSEPNKTDGEGAED